MLHPRTFVLLDIVMRPMLTMVVQKTLTGKIQKVGLCKVVAKL